MKNNNIPQYLLCPTPELARQVLEKIERESDLRFEHDFKKDEITSSGFYPELVIRTVALEGCGNPLDYSQVKFYEKKGITNFTKAEDFLLSDETKIRLEELDNKLDKLINDMTNKTWDNLEVGWLLEYDGDEFQILSIHDRVIDLSVGNNFDEVGGNFTKEELIADGFKIKGASEDKPSLEMIISELDFLTSSNLEPRDMASLKKAIEMLKKLK